MEKEASFILSGPVPPSYFVGRKEEVRRIIHQLTHPAHANTAVYGELCMGKTSLLHYLSSPQVMTQWGLSSDQYRFLSVDCSTIGPSSFWRDLLRLIANTLGDPNLSDKCRCLLEHKAFEVFELGQFFDEVANAGKVLALLLDEFESMVQKVDHSDPQVLIELRALINRPLRGLVLVVTSRQSLHSLCSDLRFQGSPFDTSFVSVPIKSFSTEEADQLFDSLGAKFSVEDRGYIHQIAGYHPMFLQVAGDLLHRARIAQPVGELHYESIGLKFVEAVGSQLSRLWQFSNEREQMLLTLLVIRRLGGRLGEQEFELAGLDKVFSRYGREVGKLKERGLVVEKSGDNRVFSTIFEWWISQEMIAKSDEDELQKRQLLYGGLVTQTEMEQINKVIEIARKNKEGLQRIMGWALARIAEGYVRGVAQR